MSDADRPQDEEIPVLFLHGIERHYRQGDEVLDILTGAELAVWAGQSVALVAPSGAGKSTLLHIAGLLEHPDKGDVYVDGQATSGRSDSDRTEIRRTEIGFVYQSHRLLPEFSALENIEMPLYLAGRAAGDRHRAATDLLARVGLSSRAAHRPGALSGGEQQRVAVARALVCRPSILLADEPTGNLDEATAGDLHALLREMHREHGLTSVIVTHNPALAAACDRVLKLEGGTLK